MLLEDIEYSNQEDVAAAVAFYQYRGEKKASLLGQHDFSKEEVLEGLENLAENAGYTDIMEMMIDRRRE